MVKMIWERKGPWEKQLLFQPVDPFNHAQTWDMFLLGVNHSWKHQSYFFIEANATRKENKSVYVKNNYYSLFFIQILFEYGKMLWMT